MDAGTENGKEASNNKEKISEAIKRGELRGNYCGTCKKKIECKPTFTIRININGENKKKKSIKTRLIEGFIKLVIENYLFVAACHVLVFLIVLHRIGVHIHG